MELPCVSQLLQVEKRKLFLSVFQKIRSHKLSPTSKQKIQQIITPLLELINDPNFVSCLFKSPRNQDYYDSIRPFLITDPNSKNSVVRNYLSFNIPRNFITQILLYESGRPVADVSQYLKKFSIPTKLISGEVNVLSNLDDPYYICDVQDGQYTDRFVPVVRYQKGMSGYLTTGDWNPEMCGTFYYFEPQSEFLLSFNTVLVTWNKITGCLDLGISLQEVYQMLYQRMRNEFFETEYSDQSSEDMEEIYPDGIGYNVHGETLEEQWFEVVLQYRDRDLDPMEHIPEMYAVEDIFDQLICKTGREKGIEGIVLKYMTGKTRVVTEVVDTRERRESFENIWVEEM